MSQSDHEDDDLFSLHKLLSAVCLSYLAFLFFILLSSLLPLFFLQIECDLCGHRCMTQEGLDLHRLSHTGQTPLKCPVRPCRRRFTSNSALEEHVLAHFQGTLSKSKNRPRFRCQICHKDFAYNSTFNVHMRTHTDERPFEVRKLEAVVCVCVSVWMKRGFLWASSNLFCPSYTRLSNPEHPYFKLKSSTASPPMVTPVHGCGHLSGSGPWPFVQCVSCGCFLPPCVPVINGRAELGPVSSPLCLLLFWDSLPLSPLLWWRGRTSTMDPPKPISAHRTVGIDLMLWLCFASYLSAMLRIEVQGALVLKHTSGCGDEF